MSSPFSSQQANSRIDEQAMTTCEKCGYTYKFFETCNCPDSRPTINGKKTPKETFEKLGKKAEKVFTPPPVKKTPTDELKLF